jgi:hypothetical protein
MNRHRVENVHRLPETQRGNKERSLPVALR